MEGSDEILHTSYTEHLHEYGTLPDRNLNFENCTRQESGQPPLAYVLAALLLDIANRPLVDCDLLRDTYDSQKNPWLSTPDEWNRNDNARVFIATDTPLSPAYPGNIYLMRITSLLFGILAVAGAYFAAATVFHSTKLAMLVGVVFAFTPQFIHLSSYFNNDISSIAFATLLIWRVLKLLRNGASRRDVIIIGVLAGLGALSKMSVLLILPAVGLALLFEARNHRQWLRQLVLNGIILGGVLLVILGPWVAYGITIYGDPIGTETHVNLDFRYDPPRPLTEVINDLDKIFITYMGKFGVSKVLLSPVVYTLTVVTFMLAALGYGYGIIMKRKQTETMQQTLVLLAMLLIFSAGFYRWYTTIFFVTGRLLHPVHITIVLFLVGGWHLLVKSTRWRTFFYTSMATLFATSGAILTPLALYDAYSIPPYQYNIEQRNLSGTQYDFEETIRFLGYDFKQAMISPHGIEMELCWEVLRPPERRGAFSVKLVRDGEILADRTSLFGMGNYDSTLWREGYRFCDRFYVPVNDPDVPENQEAPFRRDTVYDILLVVLDADTFAVDWQATYTDGTPVQFPFVGQVSTVP